MYAFLEKTAVYGREEEYEDGKKYMVTRKNLNAMTAFVTAFFVVASSQLVSIINQALSQTVLLLLLVFSFVLVAGAFHKEDREGFYLRKGWKTTFLIITFIGILFIFLNALGWLDWAYTNLIRVWDSDAIAAIVLIIVLLLAMLYIVSGSSGKKKKKSEDEEEEKKGD
jgi:uncharacterized membrane protein YfcA